ncbi:MAG TPA: hypothetical protein VLZ76_10740 [Lysobacter sp.]|jgi:hypothetical protein|nr:hypothetical protein [Lysobacter sp.]
MPTDKSKKPSSQHKDAPKKHASGSDEKHAKSASSPGSSPDKMMGKNPGKDH